MEGADKFSIVNGNTVVDDDKILPLPTEDENNVKGLCPIHQLVLFSFFIGEMRSKQEELSKLRSGKNFNRTFIRIVFQQFRSFGIFHGCKSLFKPVIIGKGVKKIGRDCINLGERSYFNEELSTTLISQSQKS